MGLVLVVCIAVGLPWAGCDEEGETALGCCVDVTLAMASELCDCEGDQVSCDMTEDQAISVCREYGANNAPYPGDDCDSCVDAIHAWTVEQCQEGEKVDHGGACDWYKDIME